MKMQIRFFPDRVFLNWQRTFLNYYRQQPTNPAVNGTPDGAQVGLFPGF
jgi:hypothetical protein